MQKIDSYEINLSTLLLLPYKIKYTKIIEINNEFIVNQKIQDIIKNSCNYYGSSYEGRIIASKNMLNLSIKLPIIIEESNLILFFPTNSPRNKECIWVSYNNLLKYTKNNYKVDLYYPKKQVISLDVSYYIFDNQITRSIKLLTEFNKRKKNLKIQ